MVTAHLHLNSTNDLLQNIILDTDKAQYDSEITFHVFDISNEQEIAAGDSCRGSPVSWYAMLLYCGQLRSLLFCTEMSVSCLVSPAT